LILSDDENNFDECGKFFLECLVLTRAVSLLSMYMTSCIENRMPPRNGNLDLYLLAVVRLVIKVTGTCNKIDSGHWMRISMNAYDDAVITQVEMEVLSSMGFDMGLITIPSYGVCEWISILVGCGQVLLKESDELDIRELIEIRAWKITLRVCYLTNVLLKYPPNSIACAILRITVEIVSDSVVIRPFVKRILQLAQVSYDDCNLLKDLIIATIG